MIKKILAFALLLCLSGFAFAGGDETAPMTEKEFDFKDFTFKNIKTDKSVNLRSFTTGKKLVLVVYFAAWCPNWHKEAPLVQKLYDKYKDKGFDVIGVANYDSIENTKNHADNFKLGFPVVSESETSDKRERTEHFKMRQAAGDTRKWGSPWNVFVEADRIEKKGDTLAKKLRVVNGEMIEAEVEAFIRQKLGLKPDEAKKSALASKLKNEVCEPDLAIKKQ